MSSLQLFAPRKLKHAVVRGDVFLLGRHKLMCGDAADKRDVAQLLGGRAPTLVVTSPPYSSVRAYNDPIACWDTLMFNAFIGHAFAPDAQILVNLGVIHRRGEIIPYWDFWLKAMRATGHAHAGTYIWDKLQAIPGHNTGSPRPSHEYIFHFRKASVPINDTEPNKDAGKVNWGFKWRDVDGTARAKKVRDNIIKAFRPIDSVLRIRAAKHNRTGHPAVFPIALPQKLIAAYRSDDGLVYDPFSGAGTTLLAAESQNIASAGMEISPQYVAMTIKRYQEAYPDHRITKALQ